MLENKYVQNVRNCFNYGIMQILVLKFHSYDALKASNKNLFNGIEQKL